MIRPSLPATAHPLPALPPLLDWLLSLRSNLRQRSPEGDAPSLGSVPSAVAADGRAAGSASARVRALLRVRPSEAACRWLPEEMGRPIGRRRKGRLRGRSVYRRSCWRRPRPIHEGSSISQSSITRFHCCPPRSPIPPPSPGHLLQGATLSSLHLPSQLILTCLLHLLFQCGETGHCTFSPFLVRAPQRRWLTRRALCPAVAFASRQQVSHEPSVPLKS